MGRSFRYRSATVAIFVYLAPGELPEVAYAEQFCSGALVSEKVILTAAHCTAFNYTDDIGIDGYYDRVWVTFDVTATANDFRCFLAEQGVPIAHGLTHPAYLRPGLRPDGRATRAQQNLQLAPDVGALILEQAVAGIEPLPLRGIGELDSIEGLVGLPAVSVGYGLNWTKLHGTQPTRGLGPQTDLGGGNEVKRIARLGPITNVFDNALWPRQSVKKGDDAVCFGDSGSPIHSLRGAPPG